MNKILLGLVLGGALGALDGGLSIVYHPEDPDIRADLGLIVLMGTFKGLVSGLVIGFFARRLGSLALGILSGLAVGFALSAPLAWWVGAHALEILLPGAIIGVILGYATQRYGSVPARIAAASEPRR